MSVGAAHSLYVKSDGSMWAMGDNSHGQLGDGTTTDRSSPVRIESSDVVSAASGDYHNLYLKNDGSLWSMGRNWFGELGDGTMTDLSTPVEIEPRSLRDFCGFIP